MSGGSTVLGLSLLHEEKESEITTAMQVWQSESNRRRMAPPRSELYFTLAAADPLNYSVPGFDSGDEPSLRAPTRVQYYTPETLPMYLKK